MPTIVPAGVNDPAFCTAQTANHIRMIGLEITQNGAFTYTLMTLGDSTGTQNNVSLMPHHIVIDRCYIHGSSSQELRRGIFLNSATTAIIECYISEVHGTGAGPGSSDTQPISGTNGSGPYLIRNNYLEGSGENFMIGGDDPQIANQVPSDMTFTSNYLFKPPAWHGVWSVKSLLEIKNGMRVLLSGNIFENCWNDAQDGTAIEFKSVNQEGTAPWCVCQDVTFQNNIIRNSASGISLSGSPQYITNGSYGGPTPMANRILVTNNLIVGQGSFGGPARVFAVSNILGLSLTHNTTLTLSGGVGCYFQAGAPMPLTQQFVYQDNITDSFVGSSDGAGTGTQGLQADMQPGWVMRNNILAGQSSTPYPSNNYFPASIAALNLNTDYSLPNGSIYLTNASDGTMVGANISAITTATSGVDATNKARVSFVGAFDATNATGTAPYSSPSFNAVAGNTLVVGIKGLAASAFSPTITDTAGNTWTQVNKDYTTGGNGLALYECHNCLGNASNVVTFTDTGSTYKAVAVGQYSGCWRKVTPVDSSVSGHGTGTGAYTTGAVSSGAANEVFVLLATDSLGGTLTIPVGWTTETTSGLTFAYQLVRSTYNTTYALTSSNGSDVIQAIVGLFK